MEIVEDIIVHPKKGKREKKISPTGVFFVTPAEAARGHALMQQEGGKRRFLYNSQLTVSSCGSTFIAGPAVGSAMAAMTLEKLIALGSERIIMYGWCGAAAEDLHVGDIVLAGAPVSGEGVSRYYPSEKDFTPTQSLIEELQSLLNKLSQDWKTGNIWTTDAPYREDWNLISTLVKEQGVVAVDMEYSALCSVAAFRGIEFAALMLVSDELYGSEWKHGFKDEKFRQRNEMLVRELIQ